MLRAADKWLAGYLASRVRAAGRLPRACHVMFCLADHFEPFGGGAGRETALLKVRRWVSDYPAQMNAFRDADGLPPRHTFFYPGDEYDAGVVEELSALTRGGWGEVEVHLHHRGDTAATLESKLALFRDRLRAVHGLLGSGGDGAPRYGFVHGNWALCNSRPDGDWCGVDDELGVLARTGCYADFTFPSAPSPTQPRMVNAIYYASDRAGQGRGHDRGVRVKAGAGCGGVPGPGGLMLVQGPLGPSWGRRKWGVFPRLENGELTAVNPPTPERIRGWVGCRIGVRGRPDWIFVKVHTHGCSEAGMAAMLDGPMAAGHGVLKAMCAAREGWKLHYVTARELYNIVRAAEAGERGDPGRFRDYEIGPPPAAA